MFTLVNAILISNSYMKNLRQIKKWFTMIELLFVIMLVSTTFMGIISAVISTTSYLTAIRQKVTALNLAKEWVEVMYNIRDTNWRRRDSKKDLTRLKNDPLTIGNNDAWVPDDWVPKDEWMHPGRRIIKVQTWADNNKDFSLEKVDSEENLLEEETEMQRDVWKLQDRIVNEWFLNEDYKLHFLNWRRYNHHDLDSFAWEDVAVWEYRRYIAIDWLYKKGTNNNEKINCTKAWDLAGECWDSSAKELRFCSIVIYTKPKFWAVQICSIMTNFEK